MQVTIYMKSSTEETLEKLLDLETGESKSGLIKKALEHYYQSQYAVKA